MAALIDAVRRDTERSPKDLVWRRDLVGSPCVEELVGHVGLASSRQASRITLPGIMVSLTSPARALPPVRAPHPA